MEQEYMYCTCIQILYPSELDARRKFHSRVTNSRVSAGFFQEVCKAVSLGLVQVLFGVCFFLGLLFRVGVLLGIQGVFMFDLGLIYIVFIQELHEFGLFFLFYCLLRFSVSGSKHCKLRSRCLGHTAAVPHGILSISGKRQPPSNKYILQELYIM